MSVEPGEETEERRDARRIAYAIAAHVLRQAVSDEVLRFQDHPRLLVISELQSLVEHLEKDAQVLVEMRERPLSERKEMHDQNVRVAQMLIEKAQARSELITVLTRHLESYDDLLAKIAAAELRNDPNWRAFTRGIVRYHRRRRKIVRKRKRRERRKELKRGGR